MKKYITTWIKITFDSEDTTPYYSEYKPNEPQELGNWKLISQSSVDSSTRYERCHTIYFTFENLNCKKDKYEDEDL